MPELTGVGGVPQKNGLGIGTIRHYVFESALLIVGVFLRFINDQQVEAFAKTALGGTGAKLYPAAIGQADILLPFGTDGFVLDVPGVQQLAQTFPSNMACRSAVGAVHDGLSLFQRPEFPHGNDFVFAVAAGNTVAILGMYP